MKTICRIVMAASACLACLTILGCGSQPDANGRGSQPNGNHADRDKFDQTLHESVKHILNEKDFKVTVQHKADAPGPVVVVIGENHASVQSQVELAELLDAMLNASVLDAVLVEGSNGKIDFADIAQRFRAAAKGQSLDALWMDQLRQGQLAGYEAVGLHRPDLTVEGVEDMEAKTRYEISKVSSFDAQNVTSLCNSLKRAKGTLLTATKALESDVSAESVAPAIKIIVDFDQAITRFETVGRKVAESQQPTSQLRLKAVRLAGKHGELVSQIPRDELDRIAKVEEQYGKRFAEYRTRVEEYNRLAANAGGYVRPNTRTTLRAERTWIENEESRLESLGEQLEAFDNSYGQALKGLAEVSSKLEDIQKELQKDVDPAVEKTAEEMNEAHAAAHDHYFKAANLLRKLRSAESEISAETQRALDAVEEFFIRDQEFMEKEQKKDAVAELAERDEAMVANTLKYLEETGKRSVALIIGHAHLTGVTNKLKDENVTFYAGGLRGNDSRAAWESRAWNARRKASTTVFSEPDGGIKELSRLLDKRWPKETEASIARLTRETMPESSSPLNDNRLLVTSRYLPHHRVNLGSHVVARGPMPGQRKRQFGVWDREVARDIVREQSDASTQFAYAYKRGSGSDAEYRVFTAEGDKPLREFRESHPAGEADYVVLFKEPDIIEENGVPISQVWDYLRPAGFRRGGGAGKGPPAGTGPGTPAPPGGRRPWYEDSGGQEGRRISLLRTHNAERAALNVKAVKRQKALDLREVTISDDVASLEDVPFTPRDGDNAGIVVIVARNEAEFRAAIGRAARARKLENKQVALITCGDAFTETTLLRESILDGKARIVWTPDRQISEKAGRKLFEAVKTRIEDAIRNGEEIRDIDQLMNESIDRLRDSEDGDLAPLPHSGSWVLIIPPTTQTRV